MKLSEAEIAKARLDVSNALNKLLSHSDPEVRACAVVVREGINRRSKIFKLLQETLGQLRVEIKYLLFDLECTRKERDAARGGSL